MFEAFVFTVHSNPCWSACDLPGFACGPEHPRSLTQRSEQGCHGLLPWALLDNLPGRAAERLCSQWDSVNKPYHSSVGGLGLATGPCPVRSGWSWTSLEVELWGSCFCPWVHDRAKAALSVSSLLGLRIWTLRRWVLPACS